MTAFSTYNDAELVQLLRQGEAGAFTEIYDRYWQILFNGKHSLARNPLITGLLHRCNYIEKAGTGIQRMRDGMKAVGLPEPIFEFSNFFTVIFKRKTLINVPWAVELNVQPNKLRRIIGILQALLNGNKLDIEEVARQYHTSGRNIRKDLELLQKKTWVQGSGNTKNKTYQLTETGKQMALKIQN